MSNKNLDEIAAALDGEDVNRYVVSERSYKRAIRYSCGCLKHVLQKIPYYKCKNKLEDCVLGYLYE